MATGTIPSFSKIDSVVTVTSSYGTVKYIKWQHVVFVLVNVSSVPTSAWTQIASGLPKSVDSVTMSGLNGASNGEVSLNMTKNGELKFYGRGNQSSSICTFVYLSSE